MACTRQDNGKGDYPVNKPSGFIIYQGPSLLDGKPIVAIATTASRNVKTGSMVSIWIMRQDIDPVTFIATASRKVSEHV